MADESYWTYQAATLTPSYDEARELGAVSDKMTDAGWHSLTPGMRREIVRSHLRAQQRAHVRALDDGQQAVVAGLWID